MYEYKRIDQYWRSHQFADGVHFQEMAFFDELVIACSGTGKKVLDIGVGDGRMPRNLLKFCTPDFYGVDLTEQLKNAPVTKVRADTRRLPFKSDTFDVVYSLGVVEHFPETAQAIAEHVRVLKPGGRMFVTTPHLSLATVFKVYQFYRSGQYRYNSFEAVRGRNLMLGEIRGILQGLPIKLIRLTGSGVREPNGPLKRVLKSVVPASLQNSHLYCIAEKV